MRWEMRKIKRFTEEQIMRANNIDIAQMLIRQGEKLKKEGTVYRWMRFDSTVIHGSEWFRHSRQTGGGPIQFMKHFYGMEFAQAVEYLLNGETASEFVQYEKQAEEKKELEIPVFSKNMHRTFAYLIKTRGISADVVSFFVKEKKILETEQYHNVAFCGYDEDGNLKQIHLRSTRSGDRFFLDIEGSDKHYYFRHMGNGKSVYVFESPIDMLSYISMNKENWQESSYVALGGVAIDALENVLNTNPGIKKVYLCFDNDKAGNEAVERIGKVLDENEMGWDRLTPTLKDWNEDLLYGLETEQTEKIEMSM